MFQTLYVHTCFINFMLEVTYMFNIHAVWMFILRNSKEPPFIFTFTVNLAVVLANAFQLKVGLLDADIYGPSIPTMMNLHVKPEVRTGAILFIYL